MTHVYTYNLDQVYYILHPMHCVYNMYYFVYAYKGVTALVSQFGLWSFYSNSFPNINSYNFAYAKSGSPFPVVSFVNTNGGKQRSSGKKSAQTLPESSSSS